MTFVRLLTFFILLFYSGNFVCAQDFSPDNQIFIKIKTPEGLHHIRLRRVKSPNTKFSLNGLEIRGHKENLILLRGKIRTKRTRKAAFYGVGGSISNNILTLDFYGHQKRIFKAKVNLENNSQQVAHAPRFLNISCGDNRNISSLVADTKGLYAKIGALPAFSPGYVAEIGIDADREYYQANSSSSSETFEAIAQTINSVNAIYLSDIGLQFDVVSQNVFTTSSQPYSSANADTLLGQFGEYTNSNSQISGDVKHLFTGKDIHYAGNYSTAGLAWVGVACSAPEFSYGLSEARSVMSSILHLIVAHEIGHNFNAEHSSDGIMAAFLSSSATSFSDFSINQISSYISGNNHCLSLAPSSGDIKLSVSKRKARLKTSLTPLRDLSGCAVSLYGARTKSSLQSDFDSLTPLFAATVNGLEKITASTKALGIRPIKKVYFRAMASCSSGDYYSSIVRLKKQSGEGEDVSVKKFLKKVRRLIKVTG